MYIVKYIYIHIYVYIYIYINVLNYWNNDGIYYGICRGMYNGMFFLGCIYIYILQATKPLGGDGRFDSMDLQIQNITKSMVYIIGDIA